MYNAPVIGALQAWHAGAFQDTTSASAFSVSGEFAGCAKNPEPWYSNEPRRDGAAERVASTYGTAMSQTSFESHNAVSFSSWRWGMVGMSISNFLGGRAQPNPVYSKDAASPSIVGLPSAAEAVGH